MSEKKFLAGFGLANITPEESVPIAGHGKGRFGGEVGKAEACQKLHFEVE